MNVLVAGATGVIGRPLVTSLIRGEHQVHALARDRGRADELRRAGAQPHVVDVFDRDEVVRAARAAEPEVVINHLTALPSDLNIRKYRAAMQPTDRLRGAPSEHLLQAAAIVGARRVVVQSQSFITAPEGREIHDESARLYHDAPAQFRDAVAALAQMERNTLVAAALDPVVLRLGFLYGPGTYFALEGTNTALIRQRRLPLVAGGAGRSSFLHVEDAAAATVAALQAGAPGVYNVTDDEPAPASQWIPLIAELLGAKPPRHFPGFLARLAAGEHAVHFATTLRGNSNDRFKQTFDWRPALTSWRTGLQRELASG